jgi:hypothetical protein
MKVLKSYSAGIKGATLQPKMIGVLWLANFIFGSVLYFLYSGLVSRSLASSEMSERLLRRFDLSVFFEFLTHHFQSIQTIIATAFVLLFFYFLVSIFLYGGILFIVASHSKFNELPAEKKTFAQAFFEGAGKFFGRFLRLAVYSLLLCVGFIVIFLILHLILHAFTADGANEKLIFYFFWIEAAVGLFLLFLIRMIVDYARIKIVQGDSRHVFSSLFRSIKFVFQNFGRTLALYYLLLLTGVIFFGIHWALESIIPSYSLVTIIITFLIAQVYIASHGWLRIAFQAGQWRFFTGHRMNQ